MEPSIETISGNYANLVTPCELQFNFRDIAWGLSRIARFNGHTKGEYAYSVAQHSVWVAWVAEQSFLADSDTILLALLHDAHEAYTGDIVSPLKSMPQLRNAIKEIENRLQSCIYQRLNIEAPNETQMALIKRVDQIALATEAFHLKNSRGHGWHAETDVIQPSEFKSALPPQEAYELFWLAYAFIESGTPLKELWCQ